MPDKYPLGLNINMGALRDWGALVTTCKLMNSSHHLAMISASGNPANDIDSVKRLHNDIGDAALMWIVRFFDAREGEWFRYKDQKRFADYCAEVKRHFPNVIFDSEANEPGVPPKDIPAFVAYQMKLINLFKERNLTYLAMCYGMGSPDWQYVLRGDFDDILYNADAISEHHYTMAWLEAGSGYPYEILLDPKNLSQYWRTKWEIQEGHFLVRRSDYYALRCQLLGIPMPLVYLTELILDQNPNAVSYLNNTYGGVWDSMRYQYGLPEYHYDLRGLNTYPNYYKDVFPNLTYDEALAKIHIHLVEDCFNVDYLKWGGIFAWNMRWDIPHGTDASRPERRPFFILMGNHAKTYTRQSAPTPAPEPQPPSAVPIDLLTYLRGDGRIYDMRYDWSGGGTQRVQTQLEGRRFFQVKGHPLATQFEWEELWHDDAYIYRGTDTSPSPDEIYQVQSVIGYGVRWFFRYARVGDTLQSTTAITFRKKSDGSLVASKPTYTFSHTIKLTNIYTQKTFGDMTIADVIELTGYLDTGQAFEKYYYAKNWGLVAWHDPIKNWTSSVVRVVTGIPNLPRLKLPWLTLPPVGELTMTQLNPHPDTIAVQPFIVKGTNSIKNIRALPTTSSAIVGQIPYPDAARFDMSVTAPWRANDYNWHLIKWHDGNTLKQGFVASSIINAVRVIEEPPPVEEPPPSDDYTAQEKSLIAAYRADDLQAMFDLIKPSLLFHDLTLGQATIAVPKPFMPLLAEVVHALGDYIEHDEGVR